MSTNPFPRFSHTAAYVSTGTDIYVYGGIVKGSAMKDVHAVDFSKYPFGLGRKKKKAVTRCDSDLGSVCFSTGKRNCNNKEENNNARAEERNTQ